MRPVSGSPRRFAVSAGLTAVVVLVVAASNGDYAVAAVAAAALLGLGLLLRLERHDAAVTWRPVIVGDNRPLTIGLYGLSMGLAALLGLQLAGGHWVYSLVLAGAVGVAVAFVVGKRFPT